MADSKVGGLLIDLHTNVARLQQDMNQAAGAVRRASDQMSASLSFVKGLVGTLFAGITVGAFATFVRNTANAADELGKLSQKTGISVESLSALKYAGSLADVSMEQLSTGLKQLNKSIDENDPAFKRLGIALTDTNGKARNTEDVMGDVADQFAGMQDGAGKTKIAMDLFGKSGADLIPLLNQGKAGLADMAAEARKAGQIISGETAAAAEQFNDNITKLGAALDGIGKSIAGPFIEMLGRMTTQMLAARDATGSWIDAMMIGFSARPVTEEIVNLTAHLEKLRATRDKLLKAPPIDTDAMGNVTGVGNAAAIDREIAEAEDKLQTLQKVLASMSAEEEKADRAQTQRRKKAPGRGETDAERQSRLAKELRAEEERFRRRIDFLEREQDVENQAAERFEDIARDTAKAREDADKAAYDARIKFLEQQQEIELAAAEEMRKTNDEIAKQTKKDNKDMIAAIEGFGRSSSRVFAEMLVNGKGTAGGLKDAFRSFFAEMVEQMLYKQVFGPIFKAGSDAFGGLLSGIFDGIGGKAIGGPVSAGTPYVVGENGPELFVPGAAGSIQRNGSMGGLVLHQVFNVDSRSDMQSVYAAARMGGAQAKAEIMRDLQRNGPFVGSPGTELEFAL